MRLLPTTVVATILRRGFLFTACALVPTFATAAPFCVSVQGLPDQCIYADGASCETRANQLRGVCVSNPAEVLPGVGSGRFCLVISNQATQCVYADRASCSVDAAKHHTACVQVAGQPGSSPFDPYAIRRPY